MLGGGSKDREPKLGKRSVEIIRVSNRPAGVLVHRYHSVARTYASSGVRDPIRGHGEFDALLRDSLSGPDVFGLLLRMDLHKARANIPFV